MRFLFAILFSFVVLTGCSSKEAGPILNKEVVKIKVLKDQEKVVAFEDNESIRTVVNAIKNAEEVKGIPKMAKPDFDVNVTLKDSSSKTFYLWINGGSPNAGIMDYNDSNKLYSVSEESTKQLRKLLKLSEKAVGDKMFVVEGYQQQLSAFDLQKVRAFAYFHEPFVVVAKNQQNEPFALLFHSSENVDKVKLPLTYESILDKFESNGYNVKSSSDKIANVQLRQINNKMIWVYLNKGEAIYLDGNGQPIDPFIK